MMIKIKYQTNKQTNKQIAKTNFMQSKSIKSSFMNKHPTAKSPPNLVLSKHNQKPNKSSKQPSQNQKLSVKTSLQHRLKYTDEFLKPDRHSKALTKSAQQPNHKNLFKNSEIKKSIELHKNNVGKVVENDRIQRKSVTSQQKYNRDAYYGNTSTSQTKSLKKISKSKLSQRSKQQSQKIPIKHQIMNQSKKHSQSSRPHGLRSPPALARKNQTSLKKKEHKRLKKLQQQYVKMLQDKLEQKQAELNTVRTRNILQEAKRLGGWVDELSEGEMRRLKRIHRTEEEMFEMKINHVKREILGVCEKDANEVLYFGGYQCEDVLSFIQGKD